MITEQSHMLPHKAVFNSVIPHSTITVAGPLIREMERQTSALIAVICACDPIPSRALFFLNATVSVLCDPVGFSFS